MLPHFRIALCGRLLLSVTLVALSATSVFAQDAEGIFPLLGRLIFGAGAPKLAIDTPQAVSVITEEDLDRDQPQNIGDLLKGVPGAQAAGASSRPLGQAFNIRGIGNTEQTASEVRIAVTVDGAPKFYESYRMGSFFGDLDLYKRVEVLRGAASATLYGAGAIGGAIAFTTKDPADYLTEGKTTALRFSAGYDSNGNGGHASATWAQSYSNAEFLGSLNVARGDDMKDGSGVIIPGTAQESWSGLVKGVFHIDGDQTLTVTASRTDTQIDDALVAMTGDTLFFGATPISATSLFGTDDVHAIDDTVTLAYNNTFSDNPYLDLTIQLSHTNTQADKSNFSMAAGCRPGDSQVLCESSFSYATTALKIENVADLSASGWKSFLTTGVQLTSQDRIGTSSLGPMPFHREGDNQQIGLYVQGEFTWDDRLTLIPGLRVDMGHLKPTQATLNVGAQNGDYTAVSPKLAALYKLNDTFSVFGSVAHTERMPTLDEAYQFNPIPGRTPLRATSPDLQKEQADTVELGFAVQRENLLQAEDSLQLKATAFHNDLKDKIVLTPASVVGPNTPYYQNIASAKIWGAELEANYDAKHWYALAAYSNVKSQDGSTGLTLPETPAENLVLTVAAKLPDQNLVVGGRGSYFGAITTSAVATSAPSYNTYDVFATWSPVSGPLAGLAVNLSIDNVFNATYRNNLSLDNAPGLNAKLTVGKSILW